MKTVDHVFMRRLGASKLKVSPFGIVVDPSISEMAKLLTQASQAGINFYQTAFTALSTSEMILANVFQNHWHKIVLASGMRSTLDPIGLMRNDVLLEACDDSLSRMTIDVIDLYYLDLEKSQASLHDLMNQAIDLVVEGKVRYLGLHHPSLAILHEAYQLYHITCVLYDISLLQSNECKAILNWCQSNSVTCVIEMPYHWLDNHDALFQLTECNSNQLFLAWLLRQSSSLMPMFYFENVDQLSEAINMIEVSFTDDVYEKIDCWASSILKQMVP